MRRLAPIQLSRVLMIPLCGALFTMDPIGLAQSAAAPLDPQETRGGVGPTRGPALDAGTLANPFANDPNAAQEGRKLFLQYNCAGCHGDHAGGGMGPSLRDATWLYGSSAQHIFLSVRQGRAHGMPSWGTKIPDD